MSNAASSAPQAATGGGREQHIQQQIRLLSRGPVRLFRNNVGSLPDPRTGRLVSFGLAPGSADLIGWRSTVITPDMVGQTVAVFASVEVKSARGRVRPDQAAWLAAVQAAGGIAGVAHTVDEARTILGM